jgi:hypothetical protein
LAYVNHNISVIPAEASVAECILKGNAQDNLSRFIRNLEDLVIGPFATLNRFSHDPARSGNCFTASMLHVGQRQTDVVHDPALTFDDVEKISRHARGNLPFAHNGLEPGGFRTDRPEFRQTSKKPRQFLPGLLDREALREEARKCKPIEV